LVDISKVAFRVDDEDTDGEVAGRNVSVCDRNRGTAMCRRMPLLLLERSQDSTPEVEVLKRRHMMEEDLKE
jgi:hypothetical protein